ncbi:MAG: hemerythrin domain-containing protein [Rhodospirillaceae bacterium]
MIFWRDQMSVDGDVIDRDHQHLIKIINQFDRFTADGLTLEEGLEILYSLKFYTQTHSKREEGLMRRAYYPRYEPHRAEHRVLLERLEVIVAELQAGAGDVPLEKGAEDTSQLLQHWLIDQVLHSDLLMRPFVDALRKAGENLEDLSSVQG